MSTHSLIHLPRTYEVYIPFTLNWNDLSNSQITNRMQQKLTLCNVQSYLKISHKLLPWVPLGHSFQGMLTSQRSSTTLSCLQGIHPHPAPCQQPRTLQRRDQGTLEGGCSRTPCDGKPRRQPAVPTGASSPTQALLSFQAHKIIH